MAQLAVGRRRRRGAPRRETGRRAARGVGPAATAVGHMAARGHPWRRRSQRAGRECARSTRGVDILLPVPSCGRWPTSVAAGRAQAGGDGLHPARRHRRPARRRCDAPPRRSRLTDRRRGGGGAAGVCWLETQAGEDAARWTLVAGAPTVDRARSRAARAGAAPDRRGCRSGRCGSAPTRRRVRRRHGPSRPVHVHRDGRRDERRGAAHGARPTGPDPRRASALRRGRRRRASRRRPRAAPP